MWCEANSVATGSVLLKGSVKVEDMALLKKRLPLILLM